MSNSSSSSGIGLGGILSIIFVVLKLVGTIHWSWIWVFSPLWIPLAFLGIIAFVALIIAGISSALTTHRRKKLYKF